MAPIRGNHTLTAMERKFAEAYLQTFNGAQAAKDAGYKAEGLNPNNALAITGNRLLKREGIRTYITELEQTAIQAAGVRTGRILRELARVAFTDLNKIATWSNEGMFLIPSDELSEDARAAISEIKVKRRRVKSDEGEEVYIEEVSVKRYDKLRALELLARHLDILGGADPEPANRPQTAINKVTNIIGDSAILAAERAYLDALRQPAIMVSETGDDSRPGTGEDGIRPIHLPGNIVDGSFTEEVDP